MRRNILTGNDAIEAYEEIQGAYSSENVPSACGYFISDDCELTKKEYDGGSIVAFDSVSGGPYEEAFSNVQDALDWLDK